MTSDPIATLVDDFLAFHLKYRPVDATFMGIVGHDHRLPMADDDAAQRELSEAKGLLQRLEKTASPAQGAARVEHSILSSALTHRVVELSERSPYRDPTFWTGEAAFGIISLLLPAAHGSTGESLAARLSDIPAMLAGGTRHLGRTGVHPDWVVRARKECRAMVALLGRGLRRHPLWTDSLAGLAESAAAAFGRYDAALGALPPADPASGRDYIGLILRDVHQMEISLEDAEALAMERFRQLGEELVDAARIIDPERSWRDLLGSLDRERPTPAQLPGAYREWHHTVMAGCGHLVTPASDYDLRFERLPEWAADVVADTYFLSYRSPPPANARDTSVYWVNGDGINLSTVKQTHAIHHASIGHHTHNARARVAPSRLARLAETGVARGVAFLSAGTTGEGWACHAQNLAAEIPGVLNRIETEIMLRDMERRNCGAVIADIRLHTGRWTLAEMRRFYAEEGGFGAGRVWGETTRNSIFPGTRVMYWLGQEAIRAARLRWKGSDSAFHDALIGQGHPTIGVALDEIQRAAA